jgi:hypothetical protein
MADFRLRFQDPTSGATRYLDEEILDLLVDAAVVEIDAMFAFASALGTAAILGSGPFQAYMERGGTFKLLVGLDAITSRPALETIASVATKYGTTFVGRVFKNEYATLFHPKLIRARRADGSQRLLVGSGNLTPGGLRSNFEAFGVLNLPAGVDPIDADWDRFLAEHKDEITPIDADALARGEANQAKSKATSKAIGGAGKAGKALPIGVPALAPEEAAEDPGDALEAVSETPETYGAAVAPTVDDRMLIAEVPKAAGRWRQVGFNGDVVEQFFQAKPNSPDRVSLSRWTGTGYEVEPTRPVVLSGINLNHRIEFRARPGDDYPAKGRPILLLREVGVRTFTYVMPYPGEPGHAELVALLAARPSVGQGVRRVIAGRGDVVAAWPGMPL